MLLQLKRSRGLLAPLAGLALCVVVLLGTNLSPNAALPTPHVTRVEEDWYIRMSSPDSSCASPQIATQMVPDPLRTDVFGIFNVNFQQLPSFLEGGLELQIWEGSQNTDVNGANGDKLRYQNERVYWTQYMEVQNDGTLKFGVKNVISSSFHGFNENTFFVTTQATFDNLDTYLTDKSALSSGITLGANRVQRIRIREVRRYMSDGSVQKDTTVRTVFTPVLN